MPIEPTEAFIAACDKCNSHYESGDGFGIFADKLALRDYLMEDDWELDGDKMFCPDCRTELTDDQIEKMNEQ